MADGGHTGKHLVLAAQMLWEVKIQLYTQTLTEFIRDGYLWKLIAKQGDA